MFYTSQQKKGSYRSILGVIFSVILVFGLFNGFWVKNAFADNNYIDNINLGYETINGNSVAYMTFHVKTTFSTHYYLEVNRGFEDDYFYKGYNNVYFPKLYYYYGCTPDAHATWILPSVALNNDLTVQDPSNWATYIGDVCSYNLPCYSYTFLAGNTYKVYFFWTEIYFWNPSASIIYYDASCYNNMGNVVIQQLGNNIPINESVSFTIYPTLSISYPHNNDEISGAFYVDGSYLVSSLDKYSRLLFWLTTPDNNTYPSAYYDLPTTSGNFHILISNIPAGYYYLNFVFTGNETYYYPDKIYLHIVNDIPEILSTGETTPSTPAFGYTSPDTYYVAHSNYSTSTALFNELSNSIGSLIQSVGNSLSAFANKFSLTDAQQTATLVASSISTIRTYSNNLNSFFGSLPVSEILFLYLIIFIAVIIFRLIKNLVNLIKP